MRGITTLVAPFRAGPPKVIPVSLLGSPIHRPLGCAYLSLRSERIVSHFTGPVTSSPFAFLGLFSACRKDPLPANSLPEARPGMFHTPWFGTPERMAWLTLLAPPAFW